MNFRDTRRCLRYIAYYGLETSFIFIGDSRIQDLYTAFVKHLMQDEDISHRPPLPQTNLSYVDNKLKIKVDFIWAPLISTYMVNSFR